MTDFLMDGSKTPRRKSRILPSMLFRRSLGTGATTNANGQGSELGTWRQSMRRDAAEGVTSAPTSFPGFDKTWSDSRRGGELNSSGEASSGPESAATAAATVVKGMSGYATMDSGPTGAKASLSTAVMLDDQPLDRLCDAMNQLVDKMTAVATIHMDLANFNESFGALLFGLKMNASNIEWTEAPTKESFERQEQREREMELMQEQQKELERIRQQQFELEQQRVAERREQERLAMEEHQRQLAAQRRLEADNSSPFASSSRSRIPRTGGATQGRPSSRPGLSRPIRPVTPSSSSTQQQSGAMRARTGRALPSSSSSSSNMVSTSRVGVAGQVRKVKGRVVMKRMLDRLPLKYREEPHRSVLVAIMASLEEHEQGQALPDLTAVSGVTRQRCNEYLGVLIQAREVSRSNQRGVAFVLNPDRYPTPQRRD
ncbi:DASH complex subunit dam1 [Actinomortierella ambigua]|uniref:DASH complex subunit DAM1 n=1 Tax=Actinomortierella ambigua TaxID=1343610 RepID=A0A9P6UBG7_9FUNG|nr:DASH complex subunit dam1 [Actinomortierella ambigua]